MTVDGPTSAATGLYFGGDKGIFRSVDYGTTNNSSLNQHFPNLEFKQGDIDGHNQGFVAGTINDESNTVLYSRLAQEWRPFMAAPNFSINNTEQAGPVTFLRSGHVVNFDGKSGLPVQTRKLDLFDRPPGWREFLAQGFSQGALTGVFGGANTLPVEAFNVPPSVVDSKGLVAVIPIQADFTSDGPAHVIWGLFLGVGGVQIAPFSVIQLCAFRADQVQNDERITALSCPDGSAFFVGTTTVQPFGGALWMATPDTSDPSGSWSLNKVPGVTGDILQISARSNLPVFIIARVASDSGRPTMVVSAISNGQVSQVRTVLDLGSPFPLRILAVPEEESLFIVGEDVLEVAQVASDNSVSTPAGILTSFGSFPSNLQSTDLRYFQDLAGNSWLYIFTNGWSVWQKRL